MFRRAPSGARHLQPARLIHKQLYRSCRRNSNHRFDAHPTRRGSPRRGWRGRRFREGEIDKASRRARQAILRGPAGRPSPDLADVPLISSHPLDLVNVWSDDEPSAPRSLRRGRAKTRPTAAEGAFRVPRSDDMLLCITSGTTRATSLLCSSRVVVRGGRPTDTLRGDTAEDVSASSSARKSPAMRSPPPTAERSTSADGELHAFPPRCRRRGKGVPIVHKDVITTKGIPTTAGSKILEGYIPVFDSTVASRCKEAGLELCIVGKRINTERVRDGLLDSEELGLRAYKEPGMLRSGAAVVLPAARAAAVAGGLAPWVLGSGHRWVHQAARFALWPRRLALPHDGKMRVPVRASSPSLELDQVGPLTIRCATTRVLYRNHRRPESVRLDDRRAAEPVRSRWRRIRGLLSASHASRNDVEGIEPGVSRKRSTNAIAARRGARRRGGGDPPPAVRRRTGSPATTSTHPPGASSNLAATTAPLCYRAEVNGAASPSSTSTPAQEGFGAETKRRIMLGPTRSRPATTRPTTVRPRRSER